MRGLRSDLVVEVGYRLGETLPVSGCGVQCGLQPLDRVFGCASICWCHITFRRCGDSRVHGIIVVLPMDDACDSLEIAAAEKRKHNRCRHASRPGDRLT